MERPLPSPGNDVDHPGQGVGTVEGRSRPPDNLDPLNIRKEKPREIEGPSCLIHLHPVHQNLHMVALGTPEERGGGATVRASLDDHQPGTSARASTTRATPRRRRSPPSNTVTWEATLPAVRGTGVPVTMNPSSSMGRIWPTPGRRQERRRSNRAKPEKAGPARAGTDHEETPFSSFGRDRGSESSLLRKPACPPTETLVSVRGGSGLLARGRLTCLPGV